MTPVERVGERSREQHHRYYSLFGSDPVNGDGFTELHTSIRELGQHASEVHTQLTQSGFSSAADAGIAAATRQDHAAFGDAAAITAAAAAAVDSSVALNIRGAAAIAAHMEGEAAVLSVIPDKASPDAVKQALATIDHNQAKSLSTVQHLASAAQDLGLAALAGSTDAIPAPSQLSQLPERHDLAALAQPGTPTGLPQLTQPLAATPAHPETPAPPPPSVHGGHEFPSAEGQYVRAVEEDRQPNNDTSDESDDVPPPGQPSAPSASTRLPPRAGPHR